MAEGDLTSTVVTLSDRVGAVFDGVDDYVEVAHNKNQLGANLSNGFTISAWVNPKSAGELSKGRILDKGTSANGDDGFIYHVGTNELVAFKMDNGGTKSSANNSVPLGTWTHVLVTINSVNLISHYVNGVLSGTPGASTEPISDIVTTNAPRIGNRATATDLTFDGSISKVKMWNRDLTTTEITQEYNGGNVEKGLILDVPLQEDYSDKSVSANTITNSGTYLTNTGSNRLMADINSLNLALATDKLVVEPVEGRDQRFKVTKIEIEAGG